MTRQEHVGELPEPSTESVRLTGESRQNKLEELGLFLLLVHKSSANRYWEIDALRGVAITMMVIYHLAYDLVLFGYYQANVLIGPWRIFARITASLFILLVGVSLAVSFARSDRLERGWSHYKKYLVRGLKLIGWGMVITLVTWVYMGKPVVIFGILHVIGAITILVYPFLSLHWVNLPIGVAMIGLGVYQGSIVMPNLAKVGKKLSDQGDPEIVASVARLETVRKRVTQALCGLAMVVLLLTAIGETL